MKTRCLAAICLAIISSGTLGSQVKAPRPNIVYILADDLGFADVGFNGGRQIATPHLDRLAASGARLDQFYVQPVCSPTRAALMTGRYPMRHGLQVGVVRPWAQYGLPLEERTLAQALKQAGYATAITGKWHLGHFEPAYLPTRRGFDVQYGHYNGAIDYFSHVRDGGHDWHRQDRASYDEGYSTELLAEEAVKFVNAQTSGQPFFLYVAFNAVHAPHQVPEAYKKPYGLLEEPRRTYAGMLAAMDAGIGQIVDALERKGFRENTLVIFSSDNGGPMPGRVTDNGALRSGKGTLYEGGVRGAACVAWPGRIKAGTVVTEPLHMVDWYPTLVKLAGASLEQKLPLDGRDAWATIAAGRASPHAEILINAAPMSGALRAGNWKLVLNGDGHIAEVNRRENGRDISPARANIELFDLAADPAERRNLAGANPKKVQELRARYQALADQAAPPKLKPRDPSFKTPKVWGEEQAVAQPRPPNIVFILADDLGVNDLGVYGRKEHRTLHLDRLAAEGLRFTTAYVASPICSPSRAAIMTGRAPARLHLTTFIPGRADAPSQKLLHPPMRQQLPLEEMTLAERLRTAGYATAMIGKWHLGGTGFSPREQGFDVYHAGQATTTPSHTEGGKGEYDLTREAERFIDANRDRPFFLYLAHNNPHIPFLLARPSFIEANSKAFEPAYAATVQTLDDSVGRLLAHLEAAGLRERTIVIFTSDNGGLHMPEGPHPRVTHNTPFRAGKGYLYEGGLRVPLIVRGPGLVSKRVIETPFVNTDWLPTLLDLVGAPVPNELDGVSQAQVLRTGSPSSGSRTFYWHLPHYTNQGSRPAGAVRDGKWKLVEHYDDERVELFDLDADAGETRDLSTAEPARAAALRKRLRDWRTSVGAQENTPNPSVDQDLYKKIYVDFDSTRFDPLRADEAAWKSVATWRGRMNAAIKRPPAGPG